MCFLHFYLINFLSFLHGGIVGEEEGRIKTCLAGGIEREEEGRINIRIEKRIEGSVLGGIE